MSEFKGFIGASYVAPTAAWDAQRSINLFLESDESGAGKSPTALLGTPGLANWLLLPTSPVRGIWTGLADNLPGSAATDLMYAAAGSKLYQIASGPAAYTLLGDVGTDAANSPCTFQVNGGQLLITSAGLAWVWNGFTLAQAFFNTGVGTLTTAGTAVTWISGTPFDASFVGSVLTISGTPYAVTAVASATALTIGSTAGNQTAVPFIESAGAGSVNTSGTAVSWTAGDVYTGLAAGMPFAIATTLYTIASVTNATALVLTGSAGTQSNAAAQYPLPVLAAMSAYLDGYGVVLPPNSKQFYISGFNAADFSDFALWNPLDYGTKSAFPDNIAAVLGNHEELWLAGSEQIEVWRDTGAANFPFQRDPGSIVQKGVRAPFSFVALGDGTAWIGGDNRGNPVAWRTTGYSEGRVSTHGVETAWASYPTVTDAVSFVFVMRGHEIWRTTFPGANSGVGATWDYDCTAGAWNEVGWWNAATSNIDRHRALYHGYAFGLHLCGDWSTGQLYTLSESNYTDGAVAIHRVRVFAHMTNEELWLFCSQFRLACLAGISPTLSWSDDASGGSPTWHAEVAATGRYLGGVSQNSMWKRLGKYRDRVWRITVTDAAQVALFAAYLETEAGDA